MAAVIIQIGHFTHTFTSKGSDCLKNQRLTIYEVRLTNAADAFIVNRKSNFVNRDPLNGLNPARVTF